MKRVNVEIDHELIQKAMTMSGMKTKKELVNAALMYFRNLLKHQEAEKQQKNENQH